VSTELQNLIDLFQSQQQLLALTEISVASMASSLANPSDRPKGIPVAGRGKGMLLVNSEDDEHLKDFAEYQP
jgi:hypothetical protein